MLGSSSCSPAVPGDATLYLLRWSHPMSKQTGHLNLTPATTVLGQDHFSCACPSQVPLPVGPRAHPPAHVPLPRRRRGPSAPSAAFPAAFGDGPVPLGVLPPGRDLCLQACKGTAPAAGSRHRAARALPPCRAQR